MKAIVLLTTIFAAVVLGSPNDSAAPASSSSSSSSSPLIVHTLPPDSQTGQTDSSINAETPLSQKSYATDAAAAVEPNNSTDFDDTSVQPSTKSNNDDPRLLVPMEKLPSTTLERHSSGQNYEDTTAGTTMLTRQVDGDFPDRTAHRSSSRMDEAVTQQNIQQVQQEQQENLMASRTEVPRWTAVYNEHSTHGNRDIHNPQQHVIPQDYDNSLKKYHRTRISGRTNADWQPAVHNDHPMARNTEIQRQSSPQRHVELSEQLPRQGTQPRMDLNTWLQLKHMQLNSQGSYLQHPNSQETQDSTQDGIRMAQEWNPTLQNDKPRERNVNIQGQHNVEFQERPNRLPVGQYSDCHPSVQVYPMDRRMQVSRQFHPQPHYQQSSYDNPSESLPQGRLPITLDSGRRMTDWHPSVLQEHTMEMSRQNDHQQQSKQSAHIPLSKTPPSNHSDPMLTPSNPAVERPMESTMDIEGQLYLQHQTMKSIVDAEEEILPRSLPEDPQPSRLSLKDGYNSTLREDRPTKRRDQDTKTRDTESQDTPLRHSRQPIVQTVLPVQQNQLPIAEHSVKTTVEGNEPTDGRTEVDDQQQHYQEVSPHNPLDNQQNKLPITQVTAKALKKSKTSLQNDGTTDGHINNQDQPVPLVQQEHSTEINFHNPIHTLPSDKISGRTLSYSNHTMQNDKPTEVYPSTRDKSMRHISPGIPLHHKLNRLKSIPKFKLHHDQPTLHQQKPTTALTTVSGNHETTSGHQNLVTESAMALLKPLEHQSHSNAATHAAKDTKDLKGATYKFPYDGPTLHNKEKAIDENDPTTTEAADEAADETTERRKKSKKGKKGRKSHRKGNGKNRKRKTKKQRRRKMTTTTEYYEDEEKITEGDEE
ncbi:blast:Probable serine/threonine-protein kinase yakA [Drosophila guanche]|uniref:Blast:Probable serine/threonine-protein kinase yakA n=1 Tax=Drosophila guanche TaxID=7266 RepID=A0A3B0JZA9_DROGU|nr:blast:Probable serine/threonine-protein kinase yakA [Drosophila guanche]